MKQVFNENQNQTIKWQDINYGDVFEYYDKCDPNVKWKGIKCFNDDDEYLLDLEDYRIYNNIEESAYLKFTRIIDCTLVEGYHTPEQDEVFDEYLNNMIEAINAD